MRVLQSVGEQLAVRVLGDKEFLGDGSVVGDAVGEFGRSCRPVVGAVRDGYVGAAVTGALSVCPVAVPGAVGFVGLLAAGAAAAVRRDAGRGAVPPLLAV
ncbi:hypothetical protein WKI65_43095 [Streptomyces sp. MS1.AVA.3]|uniref:hypothetical protein n=1 Tax=Streptomyces decoyicus TaxID=249567 RepID=UPI0030BA65EE